VRVVQRDRLRVNLSGVKVTMVEEGHVRMTVPQDLDSDCVSVDHNILRTPKREDSLAHPRVRRACEEGVIEQRDPTVQGNVRPIWRSEP
jgi:hypothetical protein